MAIQKLPENRHPGTAWAGFDCIPQPLGINQLEFVAAVDGPLKLRSVDLWGHVDQGRGRRGHGHSVDNHDLARPQVRAAMGACAGTGHHRFECTGTDSSPPFATMAR
jgi:hypothetical protein